MSTNIHVVQGDITKMQVDIIVNAANKKLSGGGGVDGAIHKAAGPELSRECRELGGCKTGEAKMTKGYNLPAGDVIHTVGPAYGMEDGDEDELLANCYINSLRLADEAGAKSIAFPNISTGIYRYPKEEAAVIAVETVRKYLKEHPDTSLEDIYFVSFTEKDFNIFKEEYENL